MQVRERAKFNGGLMRLPVYGVTLREAFKKKLIYLPVHNLLSNFLDVEHDANFSSKDI